MKIQQLSSYAGACLLFILTMSCESNGEVRDTLKTMRSRPVALHLEEMQCRVQARDTLLADSRKPDLRFVVYVDTTECSPCVLDKMYHWNDMLDETRQYHERLRYIFIIAPKSGQLEDVYLSLESSGLKSPVYIDTSYAFRKANPEFPEEPMYHAFLLDRNDSILLVGNPVSNSKIKEIFRRMVKSVKG